MVVFVLYWEWRSQVTWRGFCFVLFCFVVGFVVVGFFFFFSSYEIGGARSRVAVVVFNRGCGGQVT